MNRRILRQTAMWVMAADFPVLYVGAVTVESAVLTATALAVMVAGALVAALVY